MSSVWKEAHQNCWQPFAIVKGQALAGSMLGVKQLQFVPYRVDARYEVAILTSEDTDVTQQRPTVAHVVGNAHAFAKFPHVPTKFGGAVSDGLSRVLLRQF